VAFNGRKARQLFTRYCTRSVGNLWENITMIDLPSTSPAHAALRPPAKNKLWEQQLQPWLLSSAALQSNSEGGLQPNYPEKNRTRTHKCIPD